MDRACLQAFLDELEKIAKSVVVQGVQRFLPEARSAVSQAKPLLTGATSALEHAGGPIKPHISFSPERAVEWAQQSIPGFSQAAQGGSMSPRAMASMHLRGHLPVNPKTSLPTRMPTPEEGQRIVQRMRSHGAELQEGEKLLQQRLAFQQQEHARQVAQQAALKRRSGLSIYSTPTPVMAE